MDTPQPVELPEPEYAGENRVDPAKAAWNLTPTEERDDVGVKT